MTEQTIHEFMVSKARNMRTMLEPYIKTDAHRAMLAQYSENDIATLTQSYLSPLHATGTLSVATAHIVSELGVTDKEVEAKIGRYLLCFCETLLSATRTLHGKIV